MSEILERVARSIHLKDFDDCMADWDSLTECERADYFGMAEAAIEAMREPTRAMVYAGGYDPDSCLVSWRAMIDAALNDRPLPTPPASST